MDLSSEELQAFLAEADEGLAQLDEDFVILERTPEDHAALSRAFRAVHSIKGMCAFLGLYGVVALAHAGESLLARLRDGKLTLDSTRTTLLLRMVDDIRRMMTSFKQHGEVTEPASAALVDELGTAAADPGAPAPPAPVLVPAPRLAPAPAPTPAPTPAVAAHTALEGAAAAGLGEASIRVDLDKLDQFMNLVGELVLVRNEITQQVAAGQVPSANVVQRLNGVTGQLRDGVLEVRMQPIGKLWSNLPRVIRDLAAQLGKAVDLHTEGSETELDRAVIETIRDPLIHVVRNALDHGLERAEVRLLSGKSPRGRLSLRAWHEGGRVHVAISDDGGGINLERIRSKAVQKGLADPDRAPLLSEQELLELIFLPGFSTAEQVTDVSGRGVGMDVVRSSLERVGGNVKLTTRVGQGTTLTMSMPLTLAIESVLLVNVAGNRFAIPLTSIDEVVALSRLESFHGLPVLRLRDTLVPLADLGRVLGKRPPGPINLQGNAVIVRGDGRYYGLVVDEVLDLEEIVVKPLPRWFRRPRTFAGLTILGDGRVAIILDVAGISRRARVAATERTVAAHTGPGRSALAGPSPQTEPVILVGDGRGGRQAIRLSQVVRIEQVSRRALDMVDGRPVYQYGDRILPMVDLCPWAGPRDPLSVLVASFGDRNAALVVDELIDIAMAAPREEITHEGHAMVLVNGQLAVLQDLQVLLRRAPVPALLEASA